MNREEAINVIKGARKYLTVGNPIWNVKKVDEAMNMAIEALQEVQKHEETFEWCTDCKEYDKDNYCCHRWSKAIRNTVEELKTDRPKGEWIFNPKDAIELMFTKPKCSECGFESADGGNFCSNCGARMETNE